VLVDLLPIDELEDDRQRCHATAAQLDGETFGPA
jgi:hypothetical protein